MRLSCIVFFMLAASFAAGITGHFLPTTRERYHDKKITRERVDKREEESEQEDDVEL